MECLQRKFELYIGADNDTGVLDRDAITSLVAEIFPEGFTFVSGYGCWQGTSELMAVVTIVGNDQDADRVLSLVSKLKNALRQHSILVVTTPVAFLFL